MHIDKKPLPLDKYDIYNIDQHYYAYIVTLLNITQEQADQFEQDLFLNGEKLFHSEMVRTNGNIFNAKMVIGISKSYSNLKN